MLCAMAFWRADSPSSALLRTDPVSPVSEESTFAFHRHINDKVEVAHVLRSNASPSAIRGAVRALHALSSVSGNT